MLSGSGGIEPAAYPGERLIHSGEAVIDVGPHVNQILTQINEILTQGVEAGHCRPAEVAHLVSKLRYVAVGAAGQHPGGGRIPLTRLYLLMARRYQVGEFANP